MVLGVSEDDKALHENSHPEKPLSEITSSQHVLEDGEPLGVMIFNF